VSNGIDQPQTSPPPIGNPDRHTIGWREYVDFPDWGFKHLRAKTDTGARTSAIDVEDIEELPNNQVRFVLVRSRRHPERRLEITAPIVRRSPVKSSMGHAHHRLFVATTMKIGPVTKMIEVGLVCRHSMVCRMLIGRAALENDFIVDPHYELLLTKRPKRRRKPKP